MARGTRYEQAVAQRDDRTWSVVRLALGMAQMAGATVSFVILFLNGVTAFALAAVTMTCVFTTVSVLLFGSRKPHS